MLDRAIAAVAPKLALSRVQARTQLELIGKLGGVKRGYDAASRGRRTQNWRTPARGAVLEVQTARALIRDRARDLVRNNPWGRRAVHVQVSNQIGTGIRPRANTSSKDLNKRIDELWEEWGAGCDPSTGLDIYGIQALAARTRSESGEGLVLMSRRGENSARVPLTLQVLETDWLVEDHTSAALPQSPVREGIRFDANGRRIAYQLYDANPNDIWQSGLANFREVPARDVVHLYRIERPGQLRGVSDLASVMGRLRDLDDYHDAALMMAKVQAVLGVFVTQTGGPTASPLGAASNDELGRLEELMPGMIGYLRPGEDVKFLAPQASGPFAEYTRAALHAIAMGVGLTYHLLTGDLRDANYSSLRAGNIEFRRNVEQDQWLMLIPLLCVPIWNAFISQAVLSGALPTAAAGATALWTPPRFELVDPSRDTLAIIAQVRAGLMTMPQAIAEMGWDPEKQVAEIKAFNELVDAAGVILDTDPRRISGPGTPNDPKQLAKIELDAKAGDKP
nr:phage portal protein [Limobrevibacterium gyesilva]